jgi:hypothetical protein
MILLKLEKLIQNELHILPIWKNEEDKLYRLIFELKNITKLSIDFLEKLNHCLFSYKTELIFEKIENNIRVTIKFGV